MTQSNSPINRIIGFVLIFYSINTLEAQSLQKQNSISHTEDRIFDFGYPFLRNYSPKVYKAHAQCWGIAQGPDGRMYFSNTEGILEYDGNSWKLLKLPNGSMSRMVILGEDSTLYYSGNGDFGYMSKWADGSTKLVSLKDSLPEGSPTFNDVWGLAYWKGKVIFQASYNIFVWEKKSGKFQIFFPEKEFKRTYMVNGEVWISSLDEGLKRFNGETFVPLGTDSEPKARAYGVCSYGDGVLVTYDEGLFIYQNGIFQRLNSDIDEILPDLFILQALQLDHKNFVLVSAKNGLYYLNQEGRLLRNFTKDNGFLSNALHNVFIDESNALWVTSNYGATRMELNLPIRKFDSRNKLEDTVNDILTYNDTLYVSTHSGVFYFSIEDDNEFNLLMSPNIREAFALELVNGRLMVSSTEGIFLKENGPNFRLLTKAYAYKFEQSVADPNIIIVGSIDGLISFEFINNQFVNRRIYDKVPSMDIRSMDQDENGDIWIGTGGDNVVKVDIFNEGSHELPVVQNFDREDGLPEGTVQVHQIDGTMYFSTESGVLELREDRMIRSPKFPMFDSNVYDIYETRGGSIYVLAGDPPFMNVMALEPVSGVYKEKNAPEIQIIESSGLWMVYEDPSSTLWFGMTDGILEYRPDAYQMRPTALLTNLNRVKLNTDSIIAENLNEYSLSFDSLIASDCLYGPINNSFRFEYSLPSFTNETANVFQYKLEGLEETWSKWTTDNIKEYVDLREGEYTFRVRGKNIHNELAKPASFSFEILPPWYRTWWFAVCMLILALLVVGLIVRYFSQRKLIERVRELEFEKKIQEERERISSDLHDHVGAQLTSIISGLSITEQINDFKENPKMQHLVDSLKEDARNTMINLRDSIWSLNNESITIETLVEHIENFMESYLKYHPEIKYQIKFESHSCGLIGPTRGLNITRTIQEAIQNIIKHANAQTVQLIISGNNGKIHFEIIDDGNGFDQAEQNGEHYGMENMTRRIREIGGCLEVKSSLGNGTSVIFDI